MNRFLISGFLVILFITMLSCVSTQEAHETEVPKDTGTIETKDTGTKEMSLEEMAKLVDNLEVNDDATKDKWQIKTNIQKNQQQFSDRAYLIIELPDVFAGSAYVHTPADAKRYTGEVLATMTATDTIDVYIAYDTRIAKKPEWLSEWVETGALIVNSEASPTSFGIHKKSYNKGDTITFGSNGQSGGCLMYMILFSYPGFKGVVQESASTDFSVPVSWPGCLGMPAEWFSTDDGIRVADNLLLYQFDTGGWSKNIDMAEELTEGKKQILKKQKSIKNDSTIDNDATTSQILFLAKSYTYTKEERFKEGAQKGIQYLLEAQYPSGGWPQYYPIFSSSYYAHITFNDNAMINVMELFEDILKDELFAFVEQGTKNRVQAALEKGLAAILKSQIVVNGEKTAWCAQHHADTLLPAPARSYELESISGYESIGIIRYLMSIENPSSEIIDAVQGAVAWFDKNSISGIVLVEIDSPELPGGRDRVVVEDPPAPPIWARFYDIETSKPFFCGRDGVKKDTIAEIEHERRMGYNYYTNAPLTLLIKEYPVWQKKYAPERNVVKRVAQLSKPGWNVYDGSVLPSENTPALYESNTKGLKGESSIVDDMDIPGNKLLQFISPDGKDNKLCWTYDFGMDQQKGATILFRAKALEGYTGAMAFDIEVRSGKYRDRLIGYENGTIKLDKAGVRGVFDGQSWNIVRIVLGEAGTGGLQIDVYLNEQETPVLSGVSTVEHGDNKFRFADGSGSNYAASYYDWVIWSVTGGYGPGSELPGGLTGLEM